MFDDLVVQFLHSVGHLIIAPLPCLARVLPPLRFVSLVAPQFVRGPLCIRGGGVRILGNGGGLRLGSSGFLAGLGCQLARSGHADRKAVMLLLRGGFAGGAGGEVGGDHSAARGDGRDDDGGPFGDGHCRLPGGCVVAIVCEMWTDKLDYIRARGRWADDAEEQTEADPASEARVAAAVRGMLDLSPRELTEAIAALKSERCLDCGGEAGCYCMRDE